MMIPYGLQNVVGPLHECFVALDAVGGLRSPTNLSHAADIVSRIKAVTQAMVASATSATMTVDRDFDALRRRYAQRCQQVQDALAKAEQQQAVLERNQAGWDGVGADGVQAGALVVSSGCRSVMYRLHVVCQFCLEPRMAYGQRNGTAMEGVSMAWKGMVGVGTSQGGGGE